MRITPMDIRQQQFRVRFRGFDRQEVDTFLADVAEDYERLVKENALLKEQVAGLDPDAEEGRISSARSPHPSTLRSQAAGTCRA